MLVLALVDPPAAAQAASLPLATGQRAAAATRFRPQHWPHGRRPAAPHLWIAWPLPAPLRPARRKLWSGWASRAAAPATRAAAALRAHRHAEVLPLLAQASGAALVVGPALRPHPLCLKRRACALARVREQLDQPGRMPTAATAAAAAVALVLVLLVLRLVPVLQVMHSQLMLADGPLALALALRAHRQGTGTLTMSTLIMTIIISITTTMKCEAATQQSASLPASQPAAAAAVPLVQRLPRALQRAALHRRRQYLGRITRRRHMSRPRTAPLELAVVREQVGWAGRG